MAEAAIRASFARQAMMTTLGAAMETVASGEVALSAPVAGHVTQQHGVAHAGLTFALADSAAGYAALTTMPEGSEVVTSEFRISLLAPGAGPVLRATGRVVRPGRRLVAVAADVWGGADGTVHVATALGTMVPVRP
ncbi:PaaI family thioesterase [Jannaschia sp. Os4]|nr:PaaI family thioesterase [Jannaschia sp. Os4]